MVPNAATLEDTIMARKTTSITILHHCLDCDGQQVDVDRLSDIQYRKALTLGITAMLKSGELDYDKVKRR